MIVVFYNKSDEPMALEVERLIYRPPCERYEHGSFCMVSDGSKRIVPAQASDKLHDYSEEFAGLLANTAHRVVDLRAHTDASFHEGEG